MRKRACVWGGLALAVGLGIIPALARSAQCGQAEAPSPAEAILRRVATKYAALKSYEGTYTVTQRIAHGGQTENLTMNIAFALQRPNKMRAQFELGQDVWIVACDGQTLWTYFAKANKYFSQGARSDFGKLFETEPLAHLVYGEIRTVTFGLLGTDSYAALMKGVERTDVLGTEQLPRGETLEQVALYGKDSTLSIVVNKESSLIVQARLVPWKLVEGSKALHPELEGITVDITYEPPRAGSQQSLTSFTFAPPAGAERVEDEADLLTVNLEGKPSTDFTLEGLKEGTTFHLAEFKGKVVALDFWAVTCPPCREELPKLQAIYSKYKDKGLVLIAVNMGERRDIVAPFLARIGVDIPVALDGDMRVADSYFVSAVPTLVLIGKEGTVQFVQQGYGEGLERKISTYVEKLLSGESLVAQPKGATQ